VIRVDDSTAARSLQNSSSLTPDGVANKVGVDDYSSLHDDIQHSSENLVVRSCHVRRGVRC